MRKLRSASSVLLPVVTTITTIVNSTVMVKDATTISLHVALVLSILDPPKEDQEARSKQVRDNDGLLAHVWTLSNADPERLTDMLANVSCGLATLSRVLITVDAIKVLTLDDKARHILSPILLHKRIMSTAREGNFS